MTRKELVLSGKCHVAKIWSGPSTHQQDVWWRKGSQRMPDFAYPTKSRAVTNPSRIKRKVLCAGYNRCLDEAVNNGWAGFSCRKCHAFHRIEQSRREWLADSLACRALMQAMKNSDDSIAGFAGNNPMSWRHPRFPRNDWAKNEASGAGR